MICLSREKPVGAGSHSVPSGVVQPSRTGLAWPTRLIAVWAAASASRLIAST